MGVVRASALVPQLPLAITRILRQLGQLIWVPIENLIFLLVWITALVWPLRVLATPSVSFRDVVLPKLTYVVVRPLLGNNSVLGRRFINTV